MIVIFLQCRHIGGLNNHESLPRSTIESSKIKISLPKKAKYESIRCSHALIKNRDKRSFRKSIRSDHQTYPFIHNNPKSTLLNSSNVSNKIMVNIQEDTKPKRNGIQSNKTDLNSKSFLDHGAYNSQFNQRRDEISNNNQFDEQKTKAFILRSVSGTNSYHNKIWW